MAFKNGSTFYISSNSKATSSTPSRNHCPSSARTKLENKVNSIPTLQNPHHANSRTPSSRMPNLGSKRTHHCPGAAKGNCRRTKGLKHCTAHQAFCKEHNKYFMKGERCEVCAIQNAAQKQAERKEAARKEAQLKEAKAAKGGKR